jgi:hypothetical protein
MKSSCRFLFNYLVLPTPWILIYDDSILQFYLQCDLVSVVLDSVLINASNRLPLYRRSLDPVENTSIAQQRMSYCCHARLADRRLPCIA